MKRIVEVAFAVAFVVGVLVSSAENTTLAQVGQLYDTPLFSVQYPTGAQVKLQDDRDPGDDSVTHFYRGRLPRHSWADVDVTEFSGAVLAEDHTEVMFSKSTAKMFDPGFSGQSDHQRQQSVDCTDINRLPWPLPSNGLCLS